MDGKAVAVGFAATVGVLFLMAAGGTVFAGSVPGPFTVSMDNADITGLMMYGGAYNYPEAEDHPGEGSIPENTVPAIIQDIDTLTAPDGQTISKEIGLFGTSITAQISFDWAGLTDVFMKAEGLSSSVGTMENVTMETATDEDGGIWQQIDYAGLEDLSVETYYLTVSSMDYEGMEVSIEE